MRKQESYLEKQIMQGTMPGAHRWEDHARPGWTISRREQDSPWKSLSQWQRTEINGESTSTVWACFLMVWLQFASFFAMTVSSSSLCTPALLRTMLVNIHFLTLDPLQNYLAFGRISSITICPLSKPDSNAVKSVCHHKPFLLRFRWTMLQCIENVALEQLLIRHSYFDWHVCWTVFTVPGNSQH